MSSFLNKSLVLLKMFVFLKLILSGYFNSYIFV